jgi:hypothetical protein
VRLASVYLEANFAALFVIENHSLYILGVNSMRTFVASVIIISAEIGDKNITGTAIDGDIAIDYAVANTDVNQRLFVPEAQLVVTGKFRIAKAIATIGAWFSSVMAVVSIPAPVEVEAAAVEVIEPEAVVEAVEAIEPVITIEVVAVEVLEPEAVVEALAAEVLEPEVIVEVAEAIEPALTPAQKRAATLAAKRAKAAESELVHF